MAPWQIRAAVSLALYENMFKPLESWNCEQDDKHNPLLLTTSDSDRLEVVVGPSLPDFLLRERHFDAWHKFQLDVSTAAGRSSTSPILSATMRRRSKMYTFGLEGNVPAVSTTSAPAFRIDLSFLYKPDGASGMPSLSFHLIHHLPLYALPNLNHSTQDPHMVTYSS